MCPNLIFSSDPWSVLGPYRTGQNHRTGKHRVSAFKRIKGQTRDIEQDFLKVTTREPECVGADKRP